MAKLFLTLHVLVAVLAIGPVTVAASLFPGRARRTLQGWSDQGPEARLLHRVTRVYASIGTAIPLLGVLTAVAMGVMRDPWVITSLVLTAVAAALLLARILPGQEEILAILNEDGRHTPPGTQPQPSAHGDAGPVLRMLSTTTGVFSLLWTIVLVLMIVRPGSST
ncbi:hypothetical protein ACIQB4_28510 [Streptomyces griseoluteus]|uniref:hypothetical protein n=1 Tax=Streptomyces griseoluteus TaxID=29306 RepID=UPI00382B7FAD